MRGHIAKKGDRYYAVVYEGTDAATAKERHRWYPGGETRKEAERVLGDLDKPRLDRRRPRRRVRRSGHTHKKTTRFRGH